MRHNYAFLEPEVATWRSVLAILLFLALILVAPFFTGLFFAPANEIFAGVVGLFGLILLRRDWFRNDALKKLAHADSVWQPHVWAIAYMLFSALTNLWAASLHASLGVTLMNISGVMVLLLVRDYAQQIRKIMPYALAVSGFAVYLYGVGDAVHWWTVLDGVYDHGLLASVFQYHNTFGAFELAVGVMAYLTLSRHQRWWMNAAGYGSLILSLAAVLGSYSRVVWVLTPIALIAVGVFEYLAERKRANLIPLLLTIVFGGLAGYITLRAIHAQSGKDLVAVLVVAIAGAFVAAFSLELAARVKLSRTQVLGGAGGLLVVILGAAVVLRHHIGSGLHSVLSRLSSISLHSVSLQERFQYYKNALTMWAHNPLFGAGGSAWHAQFQAYQTLPYWSEQVHSVIFDVLLDTGIVGFVLFALILASIGVQFVRQWRAGDAASRLRIAGFLMGAGVMIAHSIVDFDFAFGFYQYVFWTLCGLAAYDVVLPVTVRKHKEARVTDRGRTQGQESAVGPKGLHATGYGVAVALGFASILAATSLSVSHVLAAQANSPTVSANTRLSLLQTAAQFAPYNAADTLALAGIDLQNGRASQTQYLINRAWAETQAAAALDPWNPAIQSQAAVLAYQLGQGPTGVEWAARAWQDAPYEVQYAADVMGLTMWTSAQEIHTNPTQATQNLNAVLNMYQTFTARAARVNPHLFPGDIALKPTAAMQVYVATTDYLLGHYNQSLKAMNPFLQAGRDQGAISLYLVNTVLDDAMLHRKDKFLGQYLAQMKANPTAQSEYAFLKTLHA